VKTRKKNKKETRCRKKVGMGKEEKVLEKLEKREKGSKKGEKKVGQEKATKAINS